MAIRLQTSTAGPPGGAPVVLAGSLGTDLMMWDGVMARLADDHHVVAVDLPGHGRSRHVAASTHLPDLAAALLDALDVAGGPPGHLVGCSLGAMAAMQLAVEYPDVVSSLTLTCTSAHLGVPDAWHDRAARVREGGMAAVAPQVVDRWFPATKHHDPELVARCRAMLLATDPEAYATYCELLAAFDLRPNLPRIACPTLVVAGKVDAATPLEHSERLAAAIGDAATLRAVQGGGHLAPAELPDEVATLARQHISGRFRATGGSDPR